MRPLTLRRLHKMYVLYVSYSNTSSLSIALPYAHFLLITFSLGNEGESVIAEMLDALRPKLCATRAAFDNLFKMYEINLDHNSKNFHRKRFPLLWPYYYAFLLHLLPSKWLYAVRYTSERYCSTMWCNDGAFFHKSNQWMKRTLHTAI